MQCRGGTPSLGVSPPHPTSRASEGIFVRPKSTFIPSFLPLRVGGRCRALCFGQGGFGLQSPWDDGAVLMPRLSQNHHGTLVEATSGGPSRRAWGSSVGNGGGGVCGTPSCPHPISQPQATDLTTVQCISPAQPRPHKASLSPQTLMVLHVTPVCGRGSRLMVAEPFPFPARRHPGSGRGE